MTRPTPLDAARAFRIDEMFFSTTDPAGRILSGNEVFVRVSGYDRAKMIGRAHNLIRHPHMPRAAFRIVWEHLQSARPAVALIKNLASDGRHYWVVAYLTPIRGGFLSIRFKPSSAWLPAVEALYAQMCGCEREHEERGASRDAGMDAAAAILQRVLRERGFDSYETFMRTLLHDEMKSRDAALAAQGLRLFPEAIEAGEGRGRLAAIHEHGCRAYEQINALYAQLDDFVQLNEQISTQAGQVLEQTADFRFIAFNAALRAARLGEEGRSLSVISEHLGAISTGTSRQVGGLVEQIGAVTDRLRVVIFSLAAARLQIEMVLSFCAELAVTRGAGEEAGRRGMIADLQLAFSDTAARGGEALGGLGQRLGALEGAAEDLRRSVLTLQVAQVTGMVEATRLRDDDSFAVMFGDLRSRVESTKLQLAELGGIGSRLAQLAGQTPEITGAMLAAARRMADEVAALGGDAIDATGSERGAARPGGLDDALAAVPAEAGVAG
ncbi:PAS domain S-box protein [Opitutus terrae]|uniref:Putative methyl-accepting chemotaxis sensory transducer n=1 Tax=Opitutus terrae (strain DSM 11246 / JCM 15787 / PB90-1) TaxID=452637 RepID=B1ZUH1_OPITP|nr:PAS domain S-box protein [Opitutus terrae]ACB74014.1 putative methyl-accepting chemotaxis sensory transducer [Opitutus terrae PB90-1]